MSVLMFNFADYPLWAFDGSSTGQSSKGDNSDLQLMPVAVYPDPFYGGKHRLVLCEVNDQDGKPAGVFYFASCMARLAY